jgi:hypothetical protein
VSAPDVVHSSAAEFGPVHKYVTAPEDVARVEAAMELLPEGNSYREYLAGLLEPQPKPYVPSADALASRVAWLESQLAQVSR